MPITAGSPILASDVLPKTVTSITQYDVTNGQNTPITTTSSQTILVIASCMNSGVSGDRIYELKYNAVTKHTMTVEVKKPFTLMFTGTALNGTYNISVNDNNGDTMAIRLTVIILG